MRGHGELWMGAREDCACLLRRGVMGCDGLNRWILHQFWFNSEYLVDEQICPGAVFHNVFVHPRVSGDKDTMPCVIDSIPERWLDGLAMIDLERRDTKAVLFVDRAFLCELFDLDVNPVSRELLIGHPYFDVGRVRALEVCHQICRAARSDHVKRRLSLPEGRRKPTCQPQVRNADCVIRVVMGKEQDIDLTKRDVDLAETYCGTRRRSEPSGL